MVHRILDVGQCGPDHATIVAYLKQHFDCRVDRADSLEDTLRQLAGGTFDLVLINRKLDCDHSDGIDILRRLKSDPSTAGVPVMLVTNYVEHQQAAVAAGGLPGFGKLEFDSPETLQRLRQALAGSSEAGTPPEGRFA